MTRRTRTLRYGAAIVVALAGVACGALIPGSAGGTAATVLVGIGLVGIVSLLFYEVGLTEDRERERARDRQRGREDRAERPPHEPDPEGEHKGGRVRPLDRRRGQRRRLR